VLEGIGILNLLRRESALGALRITQRFTEIKRRYTEKRRAFNCFCVNKVKRLSFGTASFAIVNRRMRFLGKRVHQANNI